MQIFVLKRKNENVGHDEPRGWVIRAYDSNKARDMARRDLAKYVGAESAKTEFISVRIVLTHQQKPTILLQDFLNG
jgi:hypothetical protein